MEPIAVSAPNWFILASVGTRWSEGGGEPGTTSGNPIAEFPVDVRDLQTELNIDTMIFKKFLFLCSMFKITILTKPV